MTCKRNQAASTRCKKKNKRLMFQKPREGISKKCLYYPKHAEFKENYNE